MKEKSTLKPLKINELEFKSREDFLKWQKEILDKYEEHKIEYDKEMQELLGYSNNNK